jgi:TusA-related sulfurtransferase
MSNKEVTVRLTGWKVGLSTIDLMKALCEFAEMRLSEAKRTVERLVDGEHIDVTFDDEESARRFRDVADKIGAIMPQAEE